MEEFGGAVFIVSRLGGYGCGNESELARALILAPAARGRNMQGGVLAMSAASAVITRGNESAPRESETSSSVIFTFLSSLYLLLTSSLGGTEGCLTRRDDFVLTSFPTARGPLWSSLLRRGAL